MKGRRQGRREASRQVRRQRRRTGAAAGRGRDDRAAIEEDIVLGRRHPRERLIEQDLLRSVPDPSRRRAACAVRTGTKGTDRSHPQSRRRWCAGLTPHEVREIYAVREELEVMACAFIPFPIAHAKSVGSKNFTASTALAVASGDLLTVFYSNLSFHQIIVWPVRQFLPDRDHRSVGTEGPRNTLLCQCIAEIARSRAP